MKLLTLLCLVFQVIICNGKIDPGTKSDSLKIRSKPPELADFPIAENTYTIDFNDTVILDLSQLTGSSNYLEFPVRIVSDDTINSLDFSFRFNLSDYSFDTVVDLTNNLEFLAHFNTQDNILRFTSNSQTIYPHNMSIVSVGFNVFNFEFCGLNINSALAYLNGEPCAVKIADCSETISTEEPYKGAENYSFFANLSDNSIVAVKIYDVNARVVFYSLTDRDPLPNPLPALPPGIYFIELRKRDSLSYRKMVIQF